MRQSGVLAAAGLYALSHNLPKLKRDNEIAHHLAKGIIMCDVLMTKKGQKSNIPYRFIYVFNINFICF